MTLSEYVDAARRGWIIVLATVVLALAAGAAMVVRPADVYTSSTQLFIAPASADGDPDLIAQRAVVAADRVTSYVAVVSGDLVRSQVDEAVDGIGDASMSVVVPLDTVILSITVTSGDPDHAAEVASAYAEASTEVIEEIEAPDGESTTVKVTTIDAADVPSAPDARAVTPVLGAAGIVGLGLGLTIAVLREVLRRERAQRLRADVVQGGSA